jgi:hypothetical protein
MSTVPPAAKYLLRRGIVVQDPADCTSLYFAELFSALPLARAVLL